MNKQLKISFLSVLVFCSAFTGAFSQELPKPESNKKWIYVLNKDTLIINWLEAVPANQQSFTVLGQLENDTESEVIYSKVDNAIGILIKSTTTDVKEITYTQENGVNFSTYKESDFPDMSTWECSDVTHNHNAQKTNEKPIRLPMRRMETPEIDLLVLYTTESKNQRGGKAQMESFINGFVASCNATINRSQANAKIVLLEARETDYQAHGVLNTDYFRLINKTDGHLDEVHQLREELGADLVLLLTDKDNNGTFGIASIPAGTTGNRNSAFSVCRTATAAGVYPHEIGHNLGCNHNRNRPATTTFPYAFGHYWENGGETRGSIMSYTGRRSAYFSNPDVRLDGSPTGRENLNDNARTIDNLAPYIAAYYDRPGTTTGNGPEGYIYAVDENQTINVSYKVDVAYGANDQWVYLTNQTNNVPCTNAKFGGDPVPQVAKKCYIKEAKGPYTLNPISIPGTIEMENYDRGGANVSYKDTDPENKGANTSNYRIEDGVDITSSGSGKAIGWTSVGEWVNYTIDVQEAGSYDLDIRYSSNAGSGEISLTMENGQSVGNNISFASTGGWGNYSNTTGLITLSEGIQTLKVEVVENGFNIDKITLSKSAVTSINDSNKETLSIFPNPSLGGVFHLSKETNWSVINLRGRTISSGFGSKIDLSTKEKGTYLLKMNNEVRKLVVE